MNASGNSESSARLSSLADLEPKVAAGQALDHDEALRVARCTDLISVGALGEQVRRAMHGTRVTYGRVCVVHAAAAPADRGEAAEVRLTGGPGSIAQARARVRQCAALAGGAVFTGFSLGDLVDLVGGDHLALADLARQLRADGLDGVAEAPIDRLGDAESAAEAIRAVTHGGLGVWRATVERATAADERLALAERAEALQRETQAFRAFAPLARVEPRDQPSTGYDDVRTIAVARLVCRSIGSIQVDWPLYGPKLAQVAIAYGADDIDGIAASGDEALGRRRSPREEIERHIRMAFCDPVERDGRYEPRS